MAVVGLEHRLENLNNERGLNSCRRIDQRHYKKDSRFVLDLYTLTYDSHECLESIETLSLLEKRESFICENAINSPWCRRNLNLRNGAYRYRSASLQSRIQDGNNMQVCFLNEHSSEMDDGLIDDDDALMFALPAIPQSNYPLQRIDLISLPVVQLANDVKNDSNNNSKNYHVLDTRNKENSEIVNLAQFDINCSTMSRWSFANCPTFKNFNLDVRRQRSDSPITCTIKASLRKVGEMSGISKIGGRQRMNRHMLTKMSGVQLQIIINDLHHHVEYLNEQLMTMLMDRDELHMQRDSLLVDIDDVTAYLDARQVYKKDGTIKLNQLNENHMKNHSRANIPGSCAKSLISGLRLLRI